MISGKKKSDVGWKRKERGNGVTHIGTLFKKYSETLQAPQQSVINACIEVIQEIYQYPLTTDQCRYTVASKTLTLTIKGPYKSEILLNKTCILEEIEKRVGKQNTPQNIL